MATTKRTQKNPTVEVNNSAVGIMPSSCSYKLGNGDKTVGSQSAGGNSIDIIINVSQPQVIPVTIQVNFGG